MSSLLNRQATEAQVVRGYHVAGKAIYCIAALHSFLIGDRVFHLTPTEYQVASHLLGQRERFERGQARPWMSFAVLSGVTDIADDTLLSKHARNASNKLSPVNIGFARLRTPRGTMYQMVILDKDVSRSGKNNE